MKFRGKKQQKSGHKKLNGKKARQISIFFVQKEIVWTSAVLKDSQISGAR